MSSIFLKFAIVFTLFVQGCSVPSEHPCGDLAPVFHQGLTLCVTPDYYQRNGVRRPVGLSEAFRIADESRMLLPTPSIVDTIYEQADIRLRPIPMQPGRQMASEQYINRHDSMIDQQLEQHEYGSTTLIAGHKKDIVVISRESSRVAIYGWHRDVGRPIQPLSTVHGREYYDYSHGLRLISTFAYDINGNIVVLTQQDLIDLG